MGKIGKNVLKGQFNIAQGDALGKEGKFKTVRDEKIKNVKSLIRTDLHLFLLRNLDFCIFVRKGINSLNCVVSRTILFVFN